MRCRIRACCYCGDPEGAARRHQPLGKPLRYAHQFERKLLLHDGRADGCCHGVQESVRWRAESHRGVEKLFDLVAQSGVVDGVSFRNHASSQRQRHQVHCGGPSHHADSGIACRHPAGRAPVPMAPWPWALPTSCSGTASPTPPSAKNGFLASKNSAPTCKSFHAREGGGNHLGACGQNRGCRPNVGGRRPPARSSPARLPPCTVPMRVTPGVPSAAWWPWPATWP